MDDREIKKYDMFKRVRDYGTSTSNFFLPSSIVAGLFTELDSIINQLSGYAMKKASSNTVARMGSTTKASLRDELRDALQSISRTARFMRFEQPNYEDKFRTPPRSSDQTLLTAARNIAADAAPFKSEFVLREMPENFIEELNDKIKLFEKAINEQNLGTGERVTATLSIDQNVERGMDIVREIDSIVRNKFHKDPARLAAWETAKHLTRAPRPAVVEEPSTPAPAGN